MDMGSWDSSAFLRTERIVMGGRSEVGRFQLGCLFATPATILHARTQLIGFWEPIKTTWMTKCAKADSGRTPAKARRLAVISDAVFA